MNNYPIKIDNLSFAYGKEPVLKNIDIYFEKKSIYSIIGPNGSGKTTLLKNINRILESQDGDIFIYGKNINKIKQRELAKKIAYVPQNTLIEFPFKVRDIVMMGRNPYIGNFKPETKLDFEIVDDSMNITNTYEFRDKYINELSGGERQRVIIARALAQQTDILLLDEPVSSLDIHHQVDVMSALLNLKQKRNMTIITVLHSLNLASHYSDNIILINNGQVEKIGPPQNVMVNEHIEKVYNLEVDITFNRGNPVVFPKYTLDIF